MRFILKLAISLTLALTGSMASAAIIELHSGNGVIGGTDSEITMLVGPANTHFGALSASDFTAADNGSGASIINPHGAWISTTTFASQGGNADAQWISDNAGGASSGSSALYAINFLNPYASLSMATMDFYWSADNLLGGGVDGNAGLYINSMPVGGVLGGGFTTTHSANSLDIQSFLNPGANTLYVNLSDVGGPGGVIFSASINLTDGGNVSVPEPSTLAIFALGMIGLASRRFKK
jgi:hypothetical protein